MATTYPASKQTFSNPTTSDTLASVPHATQHANINDTVEAVQDVVGTTAGTSILKNFAAGEFAVRQNSSGEYLNDAGDVVIAPFRTGTSDTYIQIGNQASGATPFISAAGPAGDLNLELIAQDNGSVVVSSPLEADTLALGTLTSNVGTIGTISANTAAIGTLSSKPLIPTRRIGSVAISGTVSTTHNLDLSLATRFLVTMPNSAGSITLTTSNVAENQPFWVEIMQGTAGSGTVNWFSTIRWAGSITPTQTFTASRKDTFGFVPTGTATFDGYIVGQNV